MKTAALLLSLLAIAGCSGKPPAPQSQPQPAAAVSTPLDPLLHDKQRAIDAQKATEQKADEQSKQIDAATQ